MSETPQSVLEKWLAWDQGSPEKLAWQAATPEVREAIRAVLDLVRVQYAANEEMTRLLSSAETEIERLRAEGLAIADGQIADRARLEGMLRRLVDGIDQWNARLRDIISPGDAAAYEEGMAALQQRADVANVALFDAVKVRGQLRVAEAALRELLDAWERAEGGRGCYSTAEHHDCRCDLDRRISEVCTCGRAELEAAVAHAIATLPAPPKPPRGEE